MTIWKDSLGYIYASPYVSDKTVGFSGIDPVQLQEDNPDIDSSEDTPVPQHDELEQILGGNEEGYYHLTLEEYNKLAELLAQRDADIEADDEDTVTLSSEEYNRLKFLLELVFDEEGAGPVFPINLDDNDTELTDFIDARVEAALSKHGLVSGGE